MDNKNVKKVEGIDKGNVMLFALSTCGWCAKTKALLKELGVRYSYIDMDLLDWDDSELANEELRKYTTRVAFPTIVYNEGERCIVGFDPDQLRELLQ